MTKIEQTADLFNVDDLRQLQPKPTGSLWEVDQRDPATLPVPLQTIIVKVDGPYTEKDRKLWVLLLYAAWDELGEKPIHSIEVSKIDTLFRELGGDHGTKWIWESAKRLAKTTFEWEMVQDGILDEQGIAPMFMARVSHKARQAGTLHYGFPHMLIPIIQNPMRFSRLRLHFMLTLSGKYSGTLYEVLEAFVNQREPVLEVDIDLLKVWLKVPEDAYKDDWKGFQKRILKHTCDQINGNPEGAGFTVEFEGVRKPGQGAAFKAVRFTMKKTPQRRRNESWILKKGENRKRKQIANDSGRPVLSVEDIAAAAEASEHYFDMKHMESDFWSFWEDQGRQKLTSPRAAFIGFCKKRYENRNR